jgi:hypothetical protein
MAELFKGITQAEVPEMFERARVKMLECHLEFEAALSVYKSLAVSNGFIELAKIGIHLHDEHADFFINDTRYKLCGIDFPLCHDVPAALFRRYLKSGKLSKHEDWRSLDRFLATAVSAKRRA